jgi:tetratricopeptide (TPR) repeat protein
LDHTGQAIVLARQVEDPAATFWAVANRMQTLIEAGAVPEAEELFGDLTTIAEEVGHPVMRWMAVFAGAQWSLLRGETATGEAQAKEALTVGHALGQPDAFNYFATQISHARWQQGRLDELVELIEIGARDNPGIPAYQGALARALLQAGRHDEARSLLDKAAGMAFADLPEDLLWSYGLSTYAEVAIQLDHRDGAAVLYDHLCPFAEYLTFVGTVCEGPIAHYLGGLCTVLGRFDAAERHLALASTLATRAGSPFYEARTMIEQGRLAGRRSDDETAGRLLTVGCELAGQWGFAGEKRRARTELAQLA